MMSLQHTGKAGSTVFFDSRSYGRTYPAGRRQIVASAIHLSDDAHYTWLNDVVCACTGEVRSRPGQDVELLLDMAELIWEPPEE